MIERTLKVLEESHRESYRMGEDAVLAAMDLAAEKARQELPDDNPIAHALQALSRVYREHRERKERGYDDA